MVKVPHGIPILSTSKQTRHQSKEKVSVPSGSICRYFGLFREAQVQRLRMMMVECSGEELVLTSQPHHFHVYIIHLVRALSTGDAQASDLPWFSVAAR